MHDRWHGMDRRHLAMQENRSSFILLAPKPKNQKSAKATTAN
jgi:hypothetical protein